MCTKDNLKLTQNLACHSTLIKDIILLYWEEFILLRLNVIFKLTRTKNDQFWITKKDLKTRIKSFLVLFNFVKTSKDGLEKYRKS